jgi:hypothetical protein
MHVVYGCKIYPKSEEENLSKKFLAKMYLRNIDQR